MITKLKHVIVSMRPGQWVKNLFIFAGLIFSGNLFHPEVLIRVSNGFILFSLVASSIYIFNDIIDLEFDRAHPEKKNRPVAAGLLSVSAAYAGAIVLALAGLRIRHPSAGSEELRMRLAAFRLPPDLLKEALGWSAPSSPSR